VSYSRTKISFPKEHIFQDKYIFTFYQTASLSTTAQFRLFVRTIHSYQVYSYKLAGGRAPAHNVEETVTTVARSEQQQNFAITVARGEFTGVSSISLNLPVSHF